MLREYWFSEVEPKSDEDDEDDEDEDDDEDADGPLELAEFELPHTLAVFGLSALKYSSKPVPMGNEQWRRNKLRIEITSCPFLTTLLNKLLVKL